MTAPIPMQIHRTRTPNLAPTGLEPGQLAVEMGSNPLRLWVGVPSSIDPLKRRELSLGGGGDDWTTGEVKLTLKNVADPGWVLCDDGTIGSDSSGAKHQGAFLEDLFKLLFSNMGDGYAPLLTSTGAATTRAAQGSAANAWSNNCRLTMTRIMGRALAVAGPGTGLTNQPLGNWGGAENVTITDATMASHTNAHAARWVVIDPDMPGNPGFYWGGWGVNTDGYLGYTGGGGAHSNWQPTAFVNVMICA